MFRFERKKINNRPYYYLTEQIKFAGKYKKIQIFVGKNIPKKTGHFFDALRAKEEKLLFASIKSGEYTSQNLEVYSVRKIELAKIAWKYHMAQCSESQQQRVYANFAVDFIYESNAIEGSKLAQTEVEAILRNKYIKKSIPAKEIIEVQNSIKCFDLLLEKTFKLNQKNLKNLHMLLVDDLNIQTGFKTQKIIVNNKETVDPKKVREELTKLFSWYKSERGTLHPFERAIIFHNRFEYIHPFTDGNGRVGRLILNWMLMESGYGLILFKNSNKTAYISALDKGDTTSYRNLLKLSVKTYNNTIDLLCTS